MSDMDLEQARRLCDELMDLSRCKPQHAHLALRRAEQIRDALQAMGGIDANPLTDYQASLRDWFEASPQTRAERERVARAMSQLRRAVESSYAEDLRPSPDAGWMPSPA